MPVRGAKAHSDRLKRMTSAGSMEIVGRALFVAGDLLKTTAQQSITEGSVSGKGHVASLPGQPPNNDTTVLANNIENVRTGPLTVEVSSNAPYARALEFGTSKMAERPYMRPATEKTRPEIVAMVVRAMKHVAAK